MTPFKICLPIWKFTDVLCHVGVALVFISSLKLKAHMSLCDHLASVVCPSILLSVRLLVSLSFILTNDAGHPWLKSSKIPSCIMGYQKDVHDKLEI